MELLGALRREDEETLAAQRLVSRYLVAGCERALFELRCSLGDARTPEAVRAGLRAAELLEEIYHSWREVLAVLGGVRLANNDEEEPRAFTCRSPPLTLR